MKHPVGKFYLKNVVLGHYNISFDGVRQNMWGECRWKSNSNKFINRRTREECTESIHYHDTFKSALELLLRIPKNWAELIVIYKVTEHKNVRCMAYPKTEKAYNNLRKWLEKI